MASKSSLSLREVTMVAAPVKVVFNYFLSVALGRMSGVRAFLPTFVVSILALIRPGRLLLNHVCCKCCPCHDDDAISDAPAGQRDVVVVAPTPPRTNTPTRYSTAARAPPPPCRRGTRARPRT